MSTIQRAWRYLITEPFIWMFLVFFQPRRFDREMEQEGRWQCFVLLLRMIVPMFLMAFPICLIGKVILVLVHLELHPDIVSILGEIAGGIAGGPLGVLAVGLAVLVPYLIFFFRLPFYFASGLSAFKAYWGSRENPEHVFTYLQRSALHWDEIAYLFLPYLKQTCSLPVT